jgi:two-component system NtrC family sensor kinase
MKTQLTATFVGDWANGGLQAALFSTCVSMCLIAMLYRRYRRPDLGCWALAFLFYAFGLVAALKVSDPLVLSLAHTFCLGLSGVFMICGGFCHLPERPRFWKAVCIAGAIVVVGGCVTTCVFPAQVWVQFLSPVLLAAAGVYIGWLFFRDRAVSRRATVLSISFALWGLSALSVPFSGDFPFLVGVGGFWSATFVLIISLTLTLDHEVALVKQEVAASEQKFRAVFDSAYDAIFLLDVETLRVIDANEAAQRLTMRRPEELAGRSILGLCPDLQEEGDTPLEHVRMLNGVFKPYNEFRIKRLNGTEVVCEGSTHRLPGQQREVTQITVREVNERRKIGEQLRRAEKLSALGQLLAGVAHEINNPLAVITGYAELLTNQAGLERKFKDNLQKILHEAERAARIVTNVLSFARPREPKRVAVDINRLVSDVLDIEATALRTGHIELVRRLASHLPRTMADAHQIEQVIINLLNNAISSMAQQKTRKLTVATEENGFAIRIIVGDTGPGISRELQRKIFDPFFTTKPPGKGTGLGLSISNTIMEEHRGRLLVESEVGRGTKFYVELPIVPCEPETDAPPPATEETDAGDLPLPDRRLGKQRSVTPQLAESPTDEEERPQVEESVRVETVAVTQPADRIPVTSEPRVDGARVLIVDDEPGIVSVLQEVLSLDGYAVDTACNGADAKKRISVNSYDAIISDICMPELDGPGLYRSIQERSPHLVKKVIFMTGDTVNPNSRAFLESTGNPWICKPFNIGDMERAVKDLLSGALLGDPGKRKCLN